MAVFTISPVILVLMLVAAFIAGISVGAWIEANNYWRKYP